MSMNEEAFGELIAKIMAQGYDEETASEFARWIGDTPLLGEDGRVVVEDDQGKVLARLEPWW